LAPSRGLSLGTLRRMYPLVDQQDDTWYSNNIHTALLKPADKDNRPVSESLGGRIPASSLHGQAGRVIVPLTLRRRKVIIRRAWIEDTNGLATVEFFISSVPAGGTCIWIHDGTCDIGWNLSFLTTLDK
jgi:hypothetical protein